MITPTDILNVVQANGAAVVAAVPHGDPADPLNAGRYDVVIRHHNPAMLPAVRIDLQELFRVHKAPNYLGSRDQYGTIHVPVLVVEAVVMTPAEAREIAA